MRRVEVVGDGKGMVGHAGVVLLRALADQTGLTQALDDCFEPGGPGWIPRGGVLAQLAAAITDGAVNIADVERLGVHHGGLFGATGSDTTIRRTLEAIDEVVLGRIANARAKVRRHVWELLAARPCGFPWLSVGGKDLPGWLVVDMDATIITAESDKEHAAGTFKGTWGHHPLAAWLANTDEALAMTLRAGNAGSNTFTDHEQVLGDAFKQISDLTHARIVVRVDGAGASHDLIEHLISLSTTRRTVRFTVGWSITTADEAAIAKLPAKAWEALLDQDGNPLDPNTGGVADLTGLATRLEHWPAGVRLIVRRVRASRRDAKKLTAYEKKTGWRYVITATNITTGLGKIPGTRNNQWVDVFHRHHAVVEDRVRTNKSFGLHNLPAKPWVINRAWMLAANIAADLDAWHRHLTLYDQPDWVTAEPKTLRFWIYTAPARLATHARKRFLRFDRDWPATPIILTAWQRITALPAPG